jgi:hypothetical protein
MQFPENYNQKKFFKYDIKKFENSIKSIKKELTKKNIYFIKLGWNKIWNINQLHGVVQQIILKISIIKMIKRLITII